MQVFTVLVPSDVIYCSKQEFKGHWEEEDLPMANRQNS